MENLKDAHGKPGQKPAPLLKRLRVLVALLVLLGLSAALVDFRGLVPHRLGHVLASTQFVPAAMALGTGALLSGICAVAILGLTLLAGRVYCSALCPLGIFQDVVNRLAVWLGKRRKALPFTKRKTLWRQFFLWSVLISLPLGWVGFALSLIDPYSNYGRLASALFRPLLTVANNAVVGAANAVGITALYRVDLPWAGFGALVFPALFLSLVLLMSGLRGRLYCNTLCPVGTLLGWLSRRAAFRIKIDSSHCTKCASCFKACKAQCIDLRKGEVDFDRCVACYDCISVCDEKGIGYEFSWGKKSVSQEEKNDGEAKAACEGAGVRDPGRRALLGRTASALALSTCLPALGLAEEKKERETPPPGHRRGRKHSVGIAPPGAMDVDRFLERCTSCHLCISACPSHVLQPALLEYGLKGFMKPRLDFAAFYCDFDCRRCAEVCPDGAITLLPLEEKQRVQLGHAHFHEERCIVKTNGTDCAACSEHCPTKAVYTVPYGDNLRLPEVKPELCIGCGACEYACPVKPEKAITVRGLHTHGRADKFVEKPASEPKKPAGDFPF